jgi:hypothetical protein
MKRVLFAVGCDTYQHLSRLYAAEADARRVFDLLIREDVGGYDPVASVLLLSPTHGQLDQALNKALYDSGHIDTFTFFFAGHGELSAASFHMEVADTDPNKLSVTALPLASLFLRLVDAAPRETNVIIDACFSGGLVADLSLLAKPEVSGKTGSSGIGLLAMSASDQYSHETSTGGVGTSAFVDCINGNTFIQDSSASLSLGEIAHSVADTVSKETGQQPCYFALSLHGKGILSKNPHYKKAVADKLREWEPAGFLETNEPVMASNHAKPSAQIEHSRAITSGLVDAARRSGDICREIELLAAGCACLLEYAPQSAEISSALRSRLTEIATKAHEAILAATAALKADKYALLTRRHALSDFYYLPIRITHLLGWLGAGVHLSHSLKVGGITRSDAQAFVSLLVEHYAPSIKLVSDSQAPFVLAGLTALNKLKVADEGETILSCLFHSTLEADGNITAYNLEPSKVLPYLWIRATNNDFNEAREILANPSEAILVLLRLATSFGLSTTFDEQLEELDHRTLNAYLPADYSLYGKKRVSGGQNASFWIGHDFWRIGELEQSWPATPKPNDEIIAGGALVSSLILPDRVPWFLAA